MRCTSQCKFAAVGACIPWLCSLAHMNKCTLLNNIMHIMNKWMCRERIATPTIYFDYILSNCVSYHYLKDQETECVAQQCLASCDERPCQLATIERPTTSDRLHRNIERSINNEQPARNHRRPAGNDRQTIISTTNARSTSQRWDRSQERVINNEHLANTEERVTGNEENIYSCSDPSAAQQQ